MSVFDALDIYLGGLDTMVRIHLLGSQHVTTLERALEESRIFANAHRYHGVLEPQDAWTLTTTPWT